ncbi:MAG: hypothetical protein RI932_725 [Pseudomonadota bacterium]|jgi:hypothetical protein
MHNDSQKLPLSIALIELIFVCVIDRELNCDPNALKPLINLEIAPEEIPDFSESWLDSALTPAHPSSCELLFRHIRVTRQLLILKALPFLPDESRAEYDILCDENRNSWTQIIAHYRMRISVQNSNLSSSELERIDFVLVTFIEWLIDVDLFRALPQQRKEYLNEFPFSERRGGGL